MSQSLYRKWRPRQWDEVIGQDHVVQTLRNAVISGRVAHAYLFAGARGTGKTTSARLLAKAVNCLAPNPADRPCNQCAPCKAVNEGHFLDLIEIDAASNTSVDDVRELRDKINYSPNQGQYKIYIIDEVHMLSTAAFNALLKTLEEPPPHAIFILATTEMHKIPATVLSRCQRHEFRRVPASLIASHLKTLADQEGLHVEADALALIARQATGSFRDAISLLDQLSSSGKPVTLEEAQRVLGTATSQHVVNLIGAILDGSPAAGLNQIFSTLDAGTDPRQFARQVVDYLRSLLLIRLGNVDQVDATTEARDQMIQLAHRFPIPALMAAIRSFNSAAVEQRSGWQPGLPLELAFAESLEHQGTPTAFSQPNDAATLYQSDLPPVGQPARPPLAAPPPAQTAPRKTEPPAGGPRAEPKPIASGFPEIPPGQKTDPHTPASMSSSIPPQSETAAVPPKNNATSEVNLQTILQNWARIRVLVKKGNSQTEALLNSCRPMGIKDGELLLGFTGELLKSKMEMGEHQEITRRAIHQVLGVAPGIRCVIANAKANSNLASDLDVDSDGMVGTALRDLGGEVVDVQ